MASRLVLTTAPSADLTVEVPEYTSPEGDTVTVYVTRFRVHFWKVLHPNGAIEWLKEVTP